MYDGIDSLRDLCSEHDFPEKLVPIPLKLEFLHFLDFEGSQSTL